MPHYKFTFEFRKTLEMPVEVKLSVIEMGRVFSVEVGRYFSVEMPDRSQK